jgi:hypothetical protein
MIELRRPGYPHRCPGRLFFYPELTRMAKKKRRKDKCHTPNCLYHKLWPSIEPVFHPTHANYWVDKDNGELFIATGLKVLSGGEVTLLDEDSLEMAMVECECGHRATVRVDLMNRGYLDRCPDCSASAAEAASN